MTDFAYLYGHPLACSCVECTQKRLHGPKLSKYRDITWNELKAFLWKRLDSQRYIPGSYVCEDFARSLRDDAKAAGLDCSLVYIDMDTCEGHMLNAFYTKDKGRVFVDCTPSLNTPLTRNYAIVNPQVGSQYTPELIFPQEGYSKYLQPIGRVKSIDVV